jgi:hypothetical protein
VLAALRTAASMAILLAALATALAGPALAAGPTREVQDLDDPQWDIDESAWASGLCGFAVDAHVAGQWTFVVYPEGSRRMLEIDHFVTRVTYTNLETGTAVKLRDIGPDRVSIRDGVVRIAVTGRAVTSQGNIGQIVFDLATGDVVFQAGREPGLYYDTLCERLAGG